MFGFYAMPQITKSDKDGVHTLKTEVFPVNMVFFVFFNSSSWSGEFAIITKGFDTVFWYSELKTSALVFCGSMIRASYLIIVFSFPIGKLGITELLWGLNQSMFVKDFNALYKTNIIKYQLKNKIQSLWYTKLKSILTDKFCNFICFWGFNMILAWHAIFINLKLKRKTLSPPTPGPGQGAEMPPSRNVSKEPPADPQRDGCWFWGDAPMRPLPPGLWSAEVQVRLWRPEVPPLCKTEGRHTWTVVAQAPDRCQDLSWPHPLPPTRKSHPASCTSCGTRLSPSLHN